MKPEKSEKEVEVGRGSQTITNLSNPSEKSKLSSENFSGIKEKCKIWGLVKE